LETNYNVTERKRLEENQQRFLANAAHQLKTPITTIVGPTELLVTKQNLDDVKRRQLLEHIFSEGHHMQRLSDTLLRLARVGWDQREPYLEVVDLTIAAERTVERMIPLAETAGLSLHVKGNGACVLADPEWLQEVLLVLLSNAMKHSSSGQKINLRARGRTITVEDEGAGISTVDLPYVFERFYRGKGSVEGFGLGLSICRELVERMGGYITLSSEEGTGTTVRVELPEADVGA
jgi:signal transduction histidine kinase